MLAELAHQAQRTCRQLACTLDALADPSTFAIRRMVVWKLPMVLFLRLM